MRSKVDVTLAFVPLSRFYLTFGFTLHKGGHQRPAGVYLHYVLDLWFEKVIKPRLDGEAYRIGSIDDCVVCFQQAGC